MYNIHRASRKHPSGRSPYPSQKLSSRIARAVNVPLFQDGPTVLFALIPVIIFIILAIVIPLLYFFGVIREEKKAINPLPPPPPTTSQPPVAPNDTSNQSNAPATTLRLTTQMPQIPQMNSVITL
jgi:hypothetical protein